MKQLWKIYACRDEDMHQGCVWLIHPELHQRSVVKIINDTNGKMVFCEALRIERNFSKNYDDRLTTDKIGTRHNALIIGEWHRTKLGNVATKQEETLKIEVYQNHWWTIESWTARYRSCLDHPQIVVRLSAILGMWGFVLGSIGVVLSAYQILGDREPVVSSSPVSIKTATAGFDWLSSVVIPALMTVILGGWVGLACTRLMIFFQARYKSVTDYYQALEKLNREESPHRVAISLAHAINPAMQEFAALGHADAAKQLNLLARAANREAARILGVPIKSGEFSNLPDVPPEVFLRFREAFIYRYYLANIADVTARLASLRPNWLAILTLNPLPRYKHTNRLAHELNEEEAEQKN